MRTILLVIALALLASACGDQPTAPSRTIKPIYGDPNNPTNGQPLPAGK